MKKLFIKIQDWFLKITRPFPTTQDQINFDLERFNIRFCRHCDAPFQALVENNYNCSALCRVRFNNKKRRINKARNKKA